MSVEKNNINRDMGNPIRSYLALSISLMNDLIWTSSYKSATSTSSSTWECSDDKNCQNVDSLDVLADGKIVLEREKVITEPRRTGRLAAEWREDVT